MGGWEYRQEMTFQRRLGGFSTNIPFRIKYKQTYPLRLQLLQCIHIPQCFSHSGKEKSRLQKVKSRFG